MWRKSVESANNVIRLNLEKAAQNLVSTLTNCADPEEVPVLKLKLDAAKHLLKLGGLEIKKVEHSGQVDFQPVVFSEEGASE